MQRAAPNTSIKRQLPGSTEPDSASTPHKKRRSPVSNYDVSNLILPHGWEQMVNRPRLVLHQLNVLDRTTINLKNDPQFLWESGKCLKYPSTRQEIGASCLLLLCNNLKT